MQEQNSNNKIKKIVMEHLIIIIVASLYIIFINISGIGCPIAAVIGKPCPTCGITRAIVSLISMDLKAYMSYNPMAIPMCIALILGVHRSFFVKYIKRIDWIVIIIVVLTLVVYLVRLKYNLITFEI